MNTNDTLIDADHKDTVQMTSNGAISVNLASHRDRHAQLNLGDLRVNIGNALQSSTCAGNLESQVAT